MPNSSHQTKAIRPILTDIKGASQLLCIPISSLYELRNTDPAFPIPVEANKKRRLFFVSELEAYACSLPRVGTAE